MTTLFVLALFNVVFGAFNITLCVVRKKVDHILGWVASVLGWIVVMLLEYELNMIV